MSEKNHRRAFRPTPPQPPWLVQLDYALADLMADLRHHWPSRLVLILLTLTSIGCILWSLQERLPLLKLAQTSIQQVNMLQTEIEQLKEQWNAGDDAQINRQLNQYESMIMPNMDTMASWLDGAVATARSGKLTLSYHLLEPETVVETPGDMRLLPVSITLKSTGSPLSLSTALAYLRAIMPTQWHIDLVDVEMHGRSEGLQQVTAIYRIWITSSAGLKHLVAETPL